jgi:hypothetical protein
MIFHFMNGGLSYDPAAVMASTAHDIVWITAACILSFIGAYMQYFGAIQMGFRDKTHSIPLACNLWFFAHDTTFVVNYHHWFTQVDFWMVRGFWFALAVFALCETTVSVQILRYSRGELFPGMSLIHALLCYAGLQLFAYGLFWWFLSMIRDPYYLLSFSTTVILAPMFNIAMLRARGSRRGFSLFMLIGFVLLTVGFWLWMFLIDPYFREPFFWLIALGNIGISIATIGYFQRLPEYRRAAVAPDHGRGAVPITAIPQ